MSLVSISEILIPARSGGYAVGAFEVWNLESVQAVVAAAEGLSQPVILQIGLVKPITLGWKILPILPSFTQGGQKYRL